MAKDGLISKLVTSGPVVLMELVALGITPNESDAQVILGFSGPTDVQAGQTVQYNLRINTSNGTSPNVSNVPITDITWAMGLTNSNNATINSISNPSSNDAFALATTTGTPYTSDLEATNSRTVSSGTAPTNINSLNYATATVTFNAPGSYTFSYADALVNGTYYPSNGLNTETFQVNVTAVPEPSTYAAIAGALALGGVAALRGRRRLLEVKGRMYEAKGRLDENGRDAVDVRDLGSLVEKKE